MRSKTKQNLIDKQSSQHQFFFLLNQKISKIKKIHFRIFFEAFFSQNFYHFEHPNNHHRLWVSMSYFHLKINKINFITTTILLQIKVLLTTFQITTQFNLTILYDKLISTNQPACLSVQVLSMVTYCNKYNIYVAKIVPNNLGSFE